MAEYLDFREISQQINFKQVVNWLCVPFVEKGDELRMNLGELLFIANTKKNTFFCPKDDSIKGGIINFTAYVLNIDLRSAAADLKQEFIVSPKVRQRELPDLKLNYCKFLEDYGISEETAMKFDVGLVKQKSIITGRIAFKIFDHDGNLSGYIGYNAEKNDWFFPKGFKRPLYNYYLYKDDNNIMLTADPFKCLFIAQQGYNCCSLLGKSMTDDQEIVLKTFTSITLYHSEPDNIVKRLYPHVFIKAPNNENPFTKE